MSKATILYRLHYFPVFKNYEMGREADPLPRIEKKRRSTDAYFVPLCLDNAAVDEAFGILNKQEQKLLTELYIDGSEDQSYTFQGEWKINIIVPEEVSQQTARRNNLSVKEMWGMVNSAIDRLVLYLNGGE